ncbi:DUF551 domain-containing protein [Klebsiella pneumoniae]
MTSKFSIDNRELLQRISSGEAVVGIDFGNLIVRELAAFRLAAMDSEPAPVVPDERDKTVDADDHPLLWSFNEGWNACRAAMLAAAPHDTPALNSVQSVVTVPGKWIPVSERMPELGDWLVTDGCDFDVQLFNGEQFIPGFVWEDKITHWMPLPADPQGVPDGK